jgi:hypothetical protein
LILCVYVVGAGNTAHIEFTFYDQVGRATVGKPPMNMLHYYHPRHCYRIDLVKAPRSDGILSWITHLSFSVNRIEHTYKPHLHSFVFGLSGSSSCTENMLLLPASPCTAIDIVLGTSFNYASDWDLCLSLVCFLLYGNSITDSASYLNCWQI